MFGRKKKTENLASWQTEPVASSVPVQVEGLGTPGAQVTINGEPLSANPASPSNPSNPSNPADPANPSNPSNPSNPGGSGEPREPDERHDPHGHRRWHDRDRRTGRTRSAG
jgi:hypothetical protein